MTLHNKQIMHRAICLKYSNCFQIKLKIIKLHMGHIYVLFYANIIYLKYFYGTPHAPKYAEIISPKRHKDIVLGMFGPSAWPPFSVTDFKRFQRHNIYDFIYYSVCYKLSMLHWGHGISCRCAHAFITRHVAFSSYSVSTSDLLLSSACDQCDPPFPSTCMGFMRAFVLHNVNISQDRRHLYRDDPGCGAMTKIT